MTNIALIGAGSLGFTRRLLRDILTFPLLRDAALSLIDIDAERLDFARRSVQHIVEMSGCPAQVQATLDRAETLHGADVVLITILAGGTQAWAGLSAIHDAHRAAAPRSGVCTRCVAADHLRAGVL